MSFLSFSARFDIGATLCISQEIQFLPYVEFSMMNLVPFHYSKLQHFLIPYVFNEKKKKKCSPAKCSNVCHDYKN